MFRFEWLALGVLVALTVALVSSQSPPAAAPTCTCVGATTRPVETDRALDLDRSIASTATYALEVYRDGAFEYAARLVRDRLADSDGIESRPDFASLQSLGQILAELAAADAIIDDKAATPTDVFVALRRAQSIDMSLGGIHAARFNARMRDVAPAAAAAYEAARDKAGAALAHHTAAMFR